MDIFSSGEEQELEAICKELTDFQKQSGFLVSYDKTTLYRIGSLRHSDAMLYNIDQYSWSNTEIMVLGVTITHDEIIKKNYEPLLEKGKNILNSWCNRGLSLQGKVNVINTLVASLLYIK